MLQALRRAQVWRDYDAARPRMADRPRQQRWRNGAERLSCHCRKAGRRPRLETEDGIRVRACVCVVGAADVAVRIACATLPHLWFRRGQAFAPLRLYARRADTTLSFFRIRGRRFAHRLRARFARIWRCPTRASFQRRCSTCLLLSQPVPWTPTLFGSTCFNRRGALAGRAGLDAAARAQRGTSR